MFLPMAKLPSQELDKEVRGSSCSMKYGHHLPKESRGLFLIVLCAVRGMVMVNNGGWLCWGGPEYDIISLSLFYFCFPGGIDFPR
jgi:hypothetical protein